MDQRTHIQALLFKWLKHFSVRSHEQIRTACKTLCINNNIPPEHSTLQLLYPLLKIGIVEFIGNGKYQVAPPIIITYPHQSTAVGINLSENRKAKLATTKYREDQFGIIRFPLANKNIQALCRELKCEHRKHTQTTPFTHFPPIKDIVQNFEKTHITTPKLQYYDTNQHEWKWQQKQTGICRTDPASYVHYLKINGEYHQIPSNTQNPEGRLLAESYQNSIERENLFTYNKQTQTLTAHNLNLPILVERLLRQNSLHQENAVKTENNFQTSYPDTPITTIKQINRIFNTKTNITNG